MATLNYTLQVFPVLIALRNCVQPEKTEFPYSSRQNTYFIRLFLVNNRKGGNFSRVRSHRLAIGMGDALDENFHHSCIKGTGDSSSGELETN